MYQTVFMSVFGVIFVLKLVFITASILFTQWNKNQESRRSSIASDATTTVSVENLDQQTGASFEEHSVNCGNHSDEGFDENAVGSFAEQSDAAKDQRSFDEKNNHNNSNVFFFAKDSYNPEALFEDSFV